MSNNAPRRESSTLVLFPGALGDLVCFFPALVEIARRSSGAVVLYCKGELAALVRSTGLAVPRPIDAREVSWLFSVEPPPEAEAFFGGFERVESFSGSGVPEVSRNLDRWFGRRAAVHPFRPEAGASGQHIATHFLLSLGARAVPLEFRVELDDEMRERARDRLRSLTAEFTDLNRRPRLIVHPGSGAVGKRWSREGFRQIAEQWRRAAGSALIVLGPAEVRELSWWTGKRLPVVSSIDTAELAALLAASDVYLGNDSGVSHLAGVVGAGGCAVFGPTDPDEWRPLSRRLAAIRLERWSHVDDFPPAAYVSRVERELERALRAAGSETLP